MIGDQVKGSDLDTWNTLRKSLSKLGKLSRKSNLEVARAQEIPPFFISINFLELGAVIYALGIDPKYVDVCLNLTKIL